MVRSFGYNAWEDYLFRFLFGNLCPYSRSVFFRNQNISRWFSFVIIHANISIAYLLALLVDFAFFYSYCSDTMVTPVHCTFYVLISVNTESYEK